MDGGYDAIYQSAPCVWGTTPGRLILWLTQEVPQFVPRRVLDAGCGEGKNSIFYARRGSAVQAVDVSQLAINHARTSWQEESSISWEVADIRQVSLPNENFDLVIAYGLLHCLSSYEEARMVVQRLQSATKIGGYHLVCSFNDRHQELEAHDGFQPLLLGHSTLSRLYERWTCLYESDKDLTESHPHNNVVHTHSLSRFAFRKAATQ